MPAERSNPCAGLWPEWLRPRSAARMLDMSESTLRCIYPVLGAFYGLRIASISGPKLHRASLLQVLDDLAAKGLDIQVNKSTGTIRVGPKEYPIRGCRRSRRGRPSKRDTDT